MFVSSAMLSFWFLECLSSDIVIPRATVKQGGLFGVRKRSLLGLPSPVEYDAFLGIPYAEPPIGKLTFLPPRPAQGWQGDRNATIEGNVCPQKVSKDGDCYKGSNDCLFLNIYVPANRNMSKLLSVMVWIHGGTFFEGTGNYEQFGPEYLIRKGNVIIVTLNYRLGIYGFLGLNSKKYPGNAGLKDQRLALDWITENIFSFGGDTSDITIFGQSAGSVAVHLHILSPTSNKFKRAISESGTILNPWAFFDDMRRHSLDVATEVHCNTGTDEDIVECLQSRPIKEVLRATQNVFEEHIVNDYQLVVAPTSEPEDGDDYFFSGSPLEVLRSGNFSKVPFVTGINSAELQSPLLVTKLDELNNNFSLVINPRMAKFIESQNLSLEEVGTKAKEFYFGSKKITILDINTIIQFSEKSAKIYISADMNYTGECIINASSDIYFVLGSWMTLFEMSCSSPKVPYYFYQFSFKPLPNSLGSLILKGVAHGQELDSLWYQDQLKNYLTIPNCTQWKVIERMTTMWTEFATTGNPSSDWQRTGYDKFQYLNIDSQLNLYGTNSDLWKRLQFWMNLLNISECNPIQ